MKSRSFGRWPSVRESLRSPDRHGRLRLTLREEMGYQNVEVTPPSGDGGVDVIADIERHYFSA